MKRGIIIFEREDYIYKLLKFRLSNYFPDSYIVRGKKGRIDSSDIPLAECIHILYDSDQFSYEQICRDSDSLDIPVTISGLCNEEYKNGRIIDCKYLANKIINSDPSLPVPSFVGNPSEHNGRIILLIPYAYMDERENMIGTEFDYLKKSTKMCLRIDLMSGIRMPVTFSGVDNSSGGLTEILDLASRSELKPEDIMAYSTPDTNGFITPGRPRHSDDVFDYGIDAVINLMEEAYELTTDPAFPLNVLIVAEGFRIKELIRIASHAGEVHFLLPERLLDEDTGFRSEIGTITRSLPHDIPVTMHYCDNILRNRNYETVKI